MISLHRKTPYFKWFLVTKRKLHLWLWGHMQNLQLRLLARQPFPLLPLAAELRLLAHGQLGLQGRHCFPLLQNATLALAAGARGAPGVAALHEIQKK